MPFHPDQLPNVPGPSAPGGSLGFNQNQFSITPQQGQAGCMLIPEGFLRDVCLSGLSFLPGGQEPTFTPTTPGAPAGPTTLPTGVVSNIQTPALVQRTVHECPRFINGKGILWMGVDGTVVCLPRGHNGRDIGLIRKNPKRKKAFISAAMIKQLKSVDKTKKKAKTFAKLAGLHTHAGHRGR